MTLLCNKGSNFAILLADGQAVYLFVYSLNSQSIVNHTFSISALILQKFCSTMLVKSLLFM